MAQVHVIFIMPRKGLERDHPTHGLVFPDFTMEKSLEYPIKCRQEIKTFSIAGIRLAA